MPEPPARVSLNPSPIRPEPIERVKSLLDRWISRTAEHLVVAMIKRGEPLTVVVSDADYQGYLETLEIMEDAEAQVAIAEGEADLRAGRVRDFDELRRSPRIA